MIERPAANEYADFYAGYIAALPPGDILEILERQKDQLRGLAANTHPVSVRALAFILAGHMEHHFKGLRDRYGIEVPA